MSYVHKVFLVIRADRTMRIVTRPRIRPDEVAIQINVTFGDRWGKVVSTVDIQAPDLDVDTELIGNQSDGLDSR